ncbi:MAG: hypothetical protein IIA82_04550 [Thaumarchaeota archaeon]|nr:hypothetical protein [Nitrososphaerota archaeon]
MKSKQNSDELEDFAHNYIPFRTKCPECIRIIKGKNHVKVHKNLASLSWHIKREHKTISTIKFNMMEIIKLLKTISKALNLGLTCSEITKICKASHLGMISY